jgi:hypothetical protein
VIGARAAGLVTALAFAAAAGSCDPVYADARAALGDEAPGVPTGPLHRPGQPCRLCHDGSLGNPPEFSVAGTVFQDASIPSQPLAGATVRLTGADGATYLATTNAAGNFFATPADFTPVYPMHTSVTTGNTTTMMQSHVGREGSCAGCHFDPPAADTPGHVYAPMTTVGGVP